MSREEEIEGRSLEYLEGILQRSRKLRIDLVLIGGYAVAAYTRGYRYTKDIDMITDRPSLGKLSGLLSDLGYSIRVTEFGIAGSKRFDRGFIDLHISIGKVHDISTNSDFQVDSTMVRHDCNPTFIRSEAIDSTISWETGRSATDVNYTTCGLSPQIR